MNKVFNYGIPALMLGSAVLGFVLATAVAKKDYALKHEQLRIDHQIEKAKAHMTTILQFNDCYINEAFYTLDREIFEIKKTLLPPQGGDAISAYAARARKTIDDYYLRFGLLKACEDCVPRSPTPNISCNS